MLSSIPIARPTVAAIQNDVKRANSAAVRAGTTWSGSDVESSWVIEAARTPSPPATTVASTVFASASWFGERPSSIAPTSFSEAARVASPKRLSRNRSESASVDGEDDRRQDEPVDRDDRAEAARSVSRGSTGGCGLRGDPERERDARLRDEQHAERGGELRERRGRAQRPEGDELDQHAERHEEQERDDQRRRRSAPRQP